MLKLTSFFVALIAFFFILNTSHLAHAGGSINSDTSAGSGNFSEGLTYDGVEDKKEKSDESGRMNWNLGLTYSHQVQAASGGEPEVVDNSSQFKGGVGYRKDFEAGLGLTYATTPAENLRSVGPDLYVGYTFHFGPKPAKKTTPAPKSDLNTDLKADPKTEAKEEKPESKFRPSLGLRLSSGWLVYTETFSGTASRTVRKRAVVAARTGSESITQNALSPEINGSPWEWLSLRFIYTRYKYNKNVGSFLNLLDSPRAVRVGASGFSSTLSGFPSKAAEFIATFYFLDVWSVEPDFTWSKSATDGSTSKGMKLTLSREIGDDWKVGLGLEHDKIPGLVENLGLLLVAYDF